MRTRRVHWAFRAATWLTAIATTTVQLIPAQGMAASRPTLHHASELPPGLTQCLTPQQWKAVDAKRAKEAAEKALHKPAVRMLSLKEMHGLHGRGVYRNKYLNGTLPWQRSFRDVNLCSGDLFKSFTDIQVAPARGAGLALQRTYNSDDDRIGPFGVGWTHAYDIRMEEAVGTDQTDYDLTSTNADLNYSARTDFFGHKMKYHRDADGLYSPPPFLFDELSSGYNAFLVNGPISVSSDTDKGMDGTVKHYTAIGNTRVCDSITDRFGNVTSLTYTTVQIGGVNTGLLNTVTDPSGRQLIFTWTNLGTQTSPAYRITAVQGPQYSVTYSYGADFNLSGVTLDPGTAPHLNRTTSFTYTSYVGQSGTETGLLASITDPAGHVVSYSYGLLAASPNTGTVWVTQIVEPAGEDPATHNPRTQTWTLAPDPTVIGGVNVSSNGGLQCSLDFDNQLRMVQFFTGKPKSGYYALTYDSANNLTQRLLQDQIDLSNSTDKYTYGQHGNVMTHTVQYFTGTDSTSWYNASQYFQKQSVTDMNLHTTTFGVGTNTAGNPGDPDPNIGDRGNVLSVQDAGYTDSSSPSYHKQYAYTYNQYGQKTSETNLNGVVTQYTYGDQWGNLTQVVQDPGTGHLNRTTTLTYDMAGHVLTSTDPNGLTTQFHYNNLGQPTEADFPATANTPAETVSYGYGANGRTESVADNRGTTTLAYEAGSDRVKSVTDPVTGTVSYTYGLNGERFSVSLPGGGTWNYTYYTQPPFTDASAILIPKDDPNSIAFRLRYITDDQGRRVDFDLGTVADPFGHLHSIRSNETYSGSTLVSYQQTDYSYDVVTGGASLPTHWWLTQVKNTFHKLVSGSWQVSTLVQNDYTFDTAGQRLTNKITNPDGSSRTESYGYDDVNRLTSVNYGDGQTQSYTFDAMSNRLSKTDVGGGINGTENYGYNAANMLLSRGANSYTNDADGNTLTGGGRTNTWDSENRLAQSVANGNTCVYVYSADGQRHRAAITNTGTTTTTDYVLDNSMLVRERRNNANYATYLVGPRGPEYRRDDTAGTVRWYLYDGLGSVIGEVDPNGNITATRKYDVYGSVRSSTGTSTSKQKFVGGLGHQSDDETGLIYMRARYIDPVTGRFVSEDPARHNTNWFVYCYNDPILYVDQTGTVLS